MVADASGAEERVRRGAGGGAEGCGGVRRSAEGARSAEGCGVRAWRGSCSTRRMPGVRRAEDFVAWQLCMELEDFVVAITANGRVAKDFDFCNQIRRSAGAAAPNIAEGFGRFTPREFARYLRIALSSLAETATHLERGRRRNYFSEEEQERAESLCRRARFMTKRLLQSKLRQIEAENNRKSRRQARG